MYFAAALLFYIWESIVAFHWVRQFDSLSAACSHMVHAMTQDSMAFLIMQDAGVFSVLAVSWMVVDMRARGVNTRQRFGWLLLIVLVGSPALLVYLGRRSSERPNKSVQPTAARSAASGG